MAKATESRMGDLHGKVCEVLIDAMTISEVPIFDKDGKQVSTEKAHPAPAMVAAATKFLKDNNIAAAADQSDGVAKLTDQLAARRAARKGNLKAELARLGEKELKAV